MKMMLLVLTVGFSVAQAKSTVAVSIQPYYTVVKNIAGDQFNVQRILPLGANPETFDPTPKDLKTVSGAALVFMNGGLDEWLHKLVKSSGNTAPAITFTEALKYKALSPIEMVGHEETEHEHGHEGADPHIFLDASIMAQAALAIGAELGKIDPSRRAFYTQNAKKENAKLLALHKELKTQLAPLKNQKLVTFHGAFNYFAAAYGLKASAAIEPFAGKQPSPRYLADVVKLVQKEQIKAIFSEPQLPEAAAKTIADSAKVKVYVLDAEGSTLTGDYYSMMRYNAQTLLKALR